MSDKRVILTRAKATLYSQGSFGLGYHKHEVRDLVVEIGPYAQYKAGVHITFTPKGARRRRGMVQTSFATLVVLDDWGHVLEPGSPWGTETKNEATGMVTKQAKYSNCSDGWNKDFRASLAEYCQAKGIKPAADFHGHSPDGFAPGEGPHVHPAGEYTWRDDQRAVD